MPAPPTPTLASKQLIEDYLHALATEPKTEALLDRYMTDPLLKEHIRQAEAAFPGYHLDADQIIAEGDSVAVRATMRGVHGGPFAGIAATGKPVRAGLLLFYRIADGRIAEHWMHLDTGALLAQLTSS